MSFIFAWALLLPSQSSWIKHIFIHLDSTPQWMRQASFDAWNCSSPMPGCMCVFVNDKTLNALLRCSGCILRPLSHYVVVYSAPAHTASGRTQSLHLKKLSSSVFPVRVESQLQSNKVSRTARGPRGGFWVLKNARREKKVFSLARNPDARKQW